MRVFLWGASALAFAFLSPGASAQKGPKPAAAQRSPDALRAIPLPPDAIGRLKSGDAGQLAAALDDVRMSGRAGAPAVPAITELLRRGLPLALSQSALETLADTESEAATETIAWYSHHRDTSLRRAAVVALGRTRGPAAIGALRAALSDPDVAVRGLSATGLGGLKANVAVGDLFVALDHKVNEAARSIGQLCLGNECDRLASKIGLVTFDVATSGLEPALLRPEEDVNDEVKVKIVGRVRELGTAEANRFLTGVQSKWPPRRSPRVKQALDQAVLATSASPGSSSGSMQ